MEEPEHLDWGGRRHPFLKNATTWWAGALVGAGAVIVLYLLAHSAASHHPVPTVQHIKANWAGTEWQLMHEREGVDPGPQRNVGCR
jgi:uncharacterized membrane protein